MLPPSVDHAALRCLCRRLQRMAGTRSALRCPCRKAPSLHVRGQRAPRVATQARVTSGEASGSTAGSVGRCPGRNRPPAPVLGVSEWANRQLFLLLLLARGDTQTRQLCGQGPGAHAHAVSQPGTGAGVESLPACAGHSWSFLSPSLRHLRCRPALLLVSPSHRHSHESSGQ